jgi:hypothetical protein
MGVCCSVMDGACFFLLCLSSDGVDGVVGFFFFGLLVLEEDSIRYRVFLMERLHIYIKTILL